MYINPEKSLKKKELRLKTPKEELELDENTYALVQSLEEINRTLHKLMEKLR